MITVIQVRGIGGLDQVAIIEEGRLDSGCILKIERTEFADRSDESGEGKGVKCGFTGFHLSLGRRELPLEAGRLWVE